jgi:rubrerythrin
MYPEFERIANEEGRLDAVLEFREQAAESAEHAAIFEKAAKRFKALTLVEKYHAAKYQKALDKVRETEMPGDGAQITRFLLFLNWGEG